jgi:hypothetical protein
MFGCVLAVGAAEACWQSRARRIPAPVIEP